MKDYERNLSLVQLLHEILTKTQKYIKPPPKLHDTDHAPNVADVVTRFHAQFQKEKKNRKNRKKRFKFSTVWSSSLL